MARRKRRLAIGTLLIIIFAILTAMALTGFLTTQTQETTDVSTTEITTASANNADQYGLLPKWQAAYNGTGTHDYTFNGSSTDITNECGNCHMSKSANKHTPPLHPIGLNETDTGYWFFDDGLHRGPNTQLATQQAGITLSGNVVNCGDCHTPTNADGFGDSATSGRTSDPHSVHRDVMTREGCIRCHVFNNRTYSGAITFTQGNATRTTYGIANPINMTRVWDGKFLSIPDEANYTYTATGPGGKYVLNTSGSGWNRYGSADSTGATEYACGDCHSQYHKNGGLGFAFDDRSDSRKGPFAPVNHTNSVGISSGTFNATCGNCHVTDAHSVHTNGKLISAANWTTANGTARATIQGTAEYSGARGAEFCDECHSQNLVLTTGTSATHGTTEAAQKLGLNGSKDNLPDALASDSGYGPSNGSGDCGFCHP